MSDLTSLSIHELTIQYRLREQSIASFVTRPATTPIQKSELEKAEEELVSFRNEIMERAMRGETVKVQPAEQEGEIYLQTQILLSHLSKLNRFSGANAEQTASFIGKVRGIVEACPSFSFARTYAAVKAHMSQPVIKTLESSGVDTFAKFEACLKDNYGTYSNTYQRLEAWLTKPKGTGTSFTTDHCETTSALEPIIDSFESEIIQMKVESGTVNYKPTFRDAFKALKILKVLQTVRNDSDDIYSSIIIELKSFKSSEQIAQRAEALSCQTAYKSVNNAEGGKVTSNKKKKASNHPNNQQKGGNGGDDRQSTPQNRGNGRGQYRGGHRGGHRGGASRGGYPSRGSYQPQNAHSSGSGYPQRGHFRGGQRGRASGDGRPYSYGGGSRGRGNSNNQTYVTFPDPHYQPIGQYDDQYDYDNSYHVPEYNGHDEYAHEADCTYVSFDSPSKN